MLQIRPDFREERFLGNLFRQEGSSHIRLLPDGRRIRDFRIQNTLAKYLGMTELKGLRLQNKFCFNWVMNCPHFYKHGKISDSWHKQTAGCNTDNPILWSKFHITHFAFRRAETDFPRYLFRAAVNIRELTLSHSTMGSLGLSYILNSCRSLESLTLDAVRFRNVDQLSDFDKPLLLEHTLPKNDSDATAHLNEALRMRYAFRDLNISNTFMMEEISAVHIIDRSQYLQSVTLFKCLKDEAKSYDETKPINKGISFHQRCVNFMTCFKDILSANANSITRLAVVDCNIPAEALEIFASVFPSLILKDLSLTITQSNISTPEAILAKLFTPQCNWSVLERFSLDFHGNISDLQIKTVLEKSINTLKVLEIITHTSDPLTEICLKSELSKMKVLETIYIKDAKDVAAKDLKDSRKLHLERQKQSNKDTESVGCNHLIQPGQTRHIIESDFCNEFILDLPPTTKELSLCGIIREKNFQERLEQFKNLPETYLNLTSLEVRGPCLINYGPKLGKLILQMRKLKSLTLSDCDLTDASLTGLSIDSARTMRKCGTYMLQNNDILKTFRPPGVKNSALENGFRFSELTDLEHLDLSSNIGISDVTIIYSLRIPHLKSLNLESCSKITDSGLEFIASILPNIQEMNLKHCRRLSKHGLNGLVRFCPKIKRIITTKTIQDNDYNIGILQPSPYFNAVVCY